MNINLSTEFNSNNPNCDILRKTQKKILPSQQGMAQK